MTVYAWMNNQVVNLGSYGFVAEKTKKEYLNCFLFDSGPSTLTWQHGCWEFEDGDPIWHHIDKEEFPKEFLVTLLLMGVT